jgi:trimethylamine--corrinoid protein Co-methyltransferase
MTNGGAHAFDFRYTNMRAGSPEEIIFRLAGIQLMRQMGVEARGTVTVMGKQPDARTAAERLAGLLIYSIAGVKAFYGAGMLAFDSIFSAEQLILDLELLAYVERFAYGMIWDEYETCRTVINRSDPITHYLTDELTLQRMRSEIWSSPIFEYTLLEQWRKEGEERTAHRIRLLVERAIANHSFELAPENKREMDAIWKRAQDKLQ